MKTTTEKKRERLTSRIGDLPITLPAGVEVIVEGAVMTVKGPKGTMQQRIPDGITIENTSGTIRVVNSVEEKRAKAGHGLARALLANMVHGVKEGFTRNLTIEGVGYRAAVQGSELELNVGYSNPVRYPIPQGITIAVDANVKVAVSGIDKCQVGQVASEIRGFRPPEPYKGKGIRYAEEKIRRKAGKSGGSK